MTNRYNLLVLEALRFFIENPYEEIHLRGFSRRLNMSINSAQRFLNLFLKERLIKDERRVNLRYFKANIDSIVFRNIKIVFSLKKIENSGLIDMLRGMVNSVVVFGSVAKGLDDPGSDVDFLIIGKDKEKGRGVCFSWEKKFDRECNFHIFTLEEWKKQKRENKAFYQEIISTGINLIGEIPI